MTTETKEKKLRLTKAQKRTLAEINAIQGGVLRLHRRGDRQILCYRLMDERKNPIKNLSYSMVNKLINRFCIKREGDVFISIKKL